MSCSEKKDKENYERPSSWRPISLLSAIGKLLEGIIAQRLKELVIKYNIFPLALFGGSGRCTSKALKWLLNPVYRAWSSKEVASMMSLDMKGAYDRVNREKLLEILIKKRIPNWIVLFVWSFISDRRAILDMPGHLPQGPFWVNNGIPQGSALSPILFLFFVSPILDLFSKRRDLGIKVTILAYVDDFYFCVRSKTYATNCRLLANLHRKMAPWIRDAKVTFSPGRVDPVPVPLDKLTFFLEKYKVIHFKKPWAHKKKWDYLPRIPGLDNKQEQLQTELRVLGVIVDRGLRWHAHVEKVSRAQSLN